jgi:tetratricopeptide (TPR) repeat protein
VTTALAHYDQALAYRQQAGDQSGIGWTLLNSGLLLRRIDPAAGHARVDAARERFEHSGDAIGLVIALGDLAGGASTQGDMGQAAVSYAQALAYAQAIHDPAGSARLLQTLGDVASEHEQSTVALQAYQEALDRYTALQDRHNQAITQGAMGAIWWWQRGDSSQARALLDAALQCTDTQDDLVDRGIILAHRGSLDLAAGHYAAAIPILEMSLTAIHTLPFHDAIAVVLLGLGRCSMALGEWDRTYRLGDEVLVHMPLSHDGWLRHHIAARVPRLLPATAGTQIRSLLQEALDQAQDGWRPHDQAALLLSVVQYAASQERWHAAHAAEIPCLLGAATMLRQQGSMPWWADEVVLLAQLEADARRHLTNTEWNEAWGRGDSLSAGAALQRAQTVLSVL